MQTRRSTKKQSRFRPALALVNGALLAALSSSAQAQMTRSRPQPSQPSAPSASGGSTDTHSSHSSQSASKDQKNGSSQGSDHWEIGRSEQGVSHGGKVNFAVLFPSERRTGSRSATPAGATYIPYPQGVLPPGGDIFGSVMLPIPPADPASSKDSDSKDSSAKDSEKGRTAAADTTSLDRYKASQEAPAASSAAHNGAGSSQIIWPYSYLSPFRGYSVDEVFWFPNDVYCGSPDSAGLYPIPGRVIVLGWPNYDLQGGVPRDEPNANYRIGEKTKPRHPVNIQSALNDIQRAFQEEQPLLLASHLQRAERLALHTPGEKRRLVTADLFLERLEALFSNRQTIALEFDPEQPLDSDLFAVTAWYVSRDRTSTVSRRKIRFVLQAQDNRVILTAFDMD